MRNKGFTLIELLAVISIIAILSGIVLVSYRAGERQLALQRAANKLAQDIRRTEGMAMTAEECQPCGGGVPAGGYGLYFFEGSDYYVLYADVQGDKHYINDNPAVTPPIEKISWGKGVYLEDVQLPPNNPVNISLNFTPPDPEINLTGGTFNEDEAEITIALEADSSKTKTITVNKAGLIDID